MSDIRLSQILGPAWYDFAHDAIFHGHTHYDASGGRGSLKSSAISIIVPTIMMQHPDVHACVFRKVGNTLRDSVYSQYIWAIGELGMADRWIARRTPMELIYKKTGQKIMFRGADDPMKIKSIKPALSGRYTALLKNGEEIVISRKYVADLKTALKE